MEGLSFGYDIDPFMYDPMPFETVDTPCSLAMITPIPSPQNELFQIPSSPTLITPTILFPNTDQTIPIPTTESGYSLKQPKHQPSMHPSMYEPITYPPPYVMIPTPYPQPGTSLPPLPLPSMPYPGFNPYMVFMPMMAAPPIMPMRQSSFYARLFHRMGGTKNVHGNIRIGGMRQGPSLLWTDEDEETYTSNHILMKIRHVILYIHYVQVSNSM